MAIVFWKYSVPPPPRLVSINLLWPQAHVLFTCIVTCYITTYILFCGRKKQWGGAKQNGFRVFKYGFNSSRKLWSKTQWVGARSWLEYFTLTCGAGITKRIVQLNLNCKTKRMIWSACKQILNAWSDMSDHEAGNQERKYWTDHKILNEQIWSKWSRANELN